MAVLRGSENVLIQAVSLGDFLHLSYIYCKNPSLESQPEQERISQGIEDFDSFLVWMQKQHTMQGFGF